MGKIIVALKTDMAAQSLLVLNLFIILVAIIGNWPAAKVLIVYWAQSVVIGFYTFLKILTYKRKSKFAFVQNLLVALFFSFHYGMFHLVYLIFILFVFAIETSNSTNPFLNLGSIFSFGFIVLLIGLFINHGFSFFKYKKEKTKTGITNIFFEPYSRIVPMHLILLFGMMFIINGFGIIVMFVFSLIKTYIDLRSHVKKHYKN